MPFFPCCAKQAEDDKVVEISKAVVREASESKSDIPTVVETPVPVLFIYRAELNRIAKQSSTDVPEDKISPSKSPKSREYKQSSRVLPL